MGGGGTGTFSKTGDMKGPKRQNIVWALGLEMRMCLESLAPPSLHHKYGAQDVSQAPSLLILESRLASHQQTQSEQGWGGQGWG